MNNDIQAIFLDLGNTLRLLVKDDEYQSIARQKIVDLLGTDEKPDKYCEILNERYKAYRVWAFETLTEAPEVDLWTKWLSPEIDASKVEPLAEELTYLFRQTNGAVIFWALLAT
jgi:putative hydrolase of the HAD superfamily